MAKGEGRKLVFDLNEQGEIRFIGTNVNYDKPNSKDIQFINAVFVKANEIRMHMMSKDLQKRMKSEDS